MRLVYKRRALRHIEAIHAYIAQHDPEAAKRVVTRIGHAANRLTVAPLSARASGPPGTRILVVPGLPYVVVHRVNQDVVEILAIFHTARRRRD